MKPTNDPRHELLEDLFSPSGKNDPLPVEDVLGLIRQGKQVRARRKCAVAFAVCAAFVVATVSSVWMSLEERFNPPIPQVVASTETPSLSREVPKVERVSDEGALALLDSTPSALIEWPDGRRTLMIVVSVRR